MIVDGLERPAVRSFPGHQPVSASVVGATSFMVLADPLLNLECREMALVESLKCVVCPCEALYPSHRVPSLAGTLPPRAVAPQRRSQLASELVERCRRACHPLTASELSALHAREPGTRALVRTRTGDPFLTMEVLYQLSYEGGLGGA